MKECTVKKLLSGRFLWAVGSIVMAMLFTITCCAVIYKQRTELPLEVLMLLLGQLLGLMSAVVGYYFMKERNGNGGHNESPETVESNSSPNN